MLIFKLCRSSLKHSIETSWHRLVLVVWDRCRLLIATTWRVTRESSSISPLILPSFHLSVCPSVAAAISISTGAGPRSPVGRAGSVGACSSKIHTGVTWRPVDPCRRPPSEWPDRRTSWRARVVDAITESTPTSGASSNISGINTHFRREISAGEVTSRLWLRSDTLLTSTSTCSSRFHPVIFTVTGKRAISVSRRFLPSRLVYEPTKQLHFVLSTKTHFSSLYTYH